MSLDSICGPAILLTVEKGEARLLTSFVHSLSVCCAFFESFIFSLSSRFFMLNRDGSVATENFTAFAKAERAAC